MKTSIRNVVRSPFFIGACLAVSLVYIESFWLGATWPWRQQFIHLLEIYGSNGFSYPMIFVAYEAIALVPLWFLWVLIFKRLGYNRPGWAAFITLVATMVFEAFSAVYSPYIFAHLHLASGLYPFLVVVDALVGGLLVFLISKFPGRKAV